jgi:hypothetical protein
VHPCATAVALPQEAPQPRQPPAQQPVKERVREHGELECWPPHESPGAGVEDFFGSHAEKFQHDCARYGAAALAAEKEALGAAVVAHEPARPPSPASRSF